MAEVTNNTNGIITRVIVEKGEQGERGTDGVSVESIEQTTTSEISEGTNVITATLSDGTTSTFNIKNGAKGAKGDTGNPGSSPLVASSVSDMTDTTRIYVLTTNGHWYYYNGSSWSDGGVYQSTGLADYSVDVNNLNLDIQNKICMKSVDYSGTNGKYINTGGSQSTSSNYSFSNPIALNKGETIIFGAAVTVNACAISKYNGEDTYNTLLVRGVGGTSINNYQYTAPADMNIVLCYNTDYSVRAYKLINTPLEQYVGLINTFTYEEGHYIHKNEYKAAQQFYNITEPISVKKGQLIKASCYAGASVAVIAKYNETDESYGCLVVGEGSEKTYTYIPDEDMYIIISYDHDYSIEISIQYTNESITSLISKMASNNKTDILSIFNNITCCGDSLTYSQVYTGGPSRQAYVPYPTVLARRTGATTENLAVSGYNATQWWNNYNSQIVQKTNQLAIIYLGTNGGLTDTIDTDCVGDDYTTYSDNHTGNYGKIIQKFLDVGARVILVKIYSDAGETINPIIDKFATRFNVAVIDNKRLEDDIYHLYPNLTGSNYLHYNDLGYTAFTDQLINSVNNLTDEMKKRIFPQ